MTFIRRILDPTIIATNQEPPAEVTPQSQPKPETSFGIASSSDLFVTSLPSSFEFLEQPPQSVALTEPSITSEMTVDASSIFTQVETAPMVLDQALQDLLDRLKPLKEKRQELITQISEAHEKILQAHEALSKVSEALDSDKPISDEVQDVLGKLGILGIIGGLPAIPIVGGILGMLGLSEDYKMKLQKALAEGHRQLGDLQLNLHQLQQQLEGVNSEIDSITNEITEKERSFQTDSSFTNGMVAEPMLATTERRSKPDSGRKQSICGFVQTDGSKER